MLFQIMHMPILLFRELFENKMLIEVVLGQVADGQANNTAEVAHFLGLKYVLEAKFEAPENYSRGQAHDNVESESLGVVGDATGTEAEDVAFVEDVFDDEPNPGTHND